MVTRALIMERFGGNTGLFIKVLPKFRVTVEEQLRRLETALEEDDYKNAHAALHTLKGTAGTLAATELAEQAAELEQKLKSSESGDWQAELSTQRLSVLKDAFEHSAVTLEKLAEQLGHL